MIWLDCNEQYCGAKDNLMKILNKIQSYRDVLVIGGGITGIKTALDASEIGKSVVVIESNSNIGGLVTNLDRTFPTNNCDLCTIAPNVSEEHRNLKIRFMTMTEVIGLTGEVGNFTATLKTLPRYIDLELCNACGKCKELFPDIINLCPGLDNRAPTCMRYPKITPAAFSVDMDKCPPNNISKLVDCCPEGAILPKDSIQNTVINFGSIVLASGADLFVPDKMDHFGFGKLPNLLTNLEYEQLLSATGPTNGQLIRPSDGKQPENIAWIQCVGSRGKQGGSVPYCSTICCMAALKEAIITKERVHSEIKTTIFYMDMRTCGKEYENYLNKAKTANNIRLIRNKPHSLVKAPNNDISVSYSTYDGSSSIVEEKFDMVVLSTGFTANKKNLNISEILEIELNEHGFMQTNEFDSIKSSRPGIYACGNTEAPKDIPYSMIQASAVACLSETNNSPIKQDKKSLYTSESKDIAIYDNPRVGVFICECGENIGTSLDLYEIASTIKKLSKVIFVKVLKYSCNTDSIKYIGDSIALKDLNRIVIAGCSPKTHEFMFQDVIERAGLNKNMLEMANIREQNSWVHLNSQNKANEKALKLIKAAVNSIILAKPICNQTISVVQKALVVGGGISGMTAALQLANFGNKVFLVERMSVLGGVSNLISSTIEGGDVKKLIETLINDVYNNENIEVVTNASIVDHAGQAGMFTTGFQVGTTISYRQISHGVTVITTGLLPSRPNEYSLGLHDNILTQLELEDKIAFSSSWVEELKTIVIIQCVGSRCDDNPDCSRVCCPSALKNALKLLEMNQNLRIFILYRDIRVNGFYEKYYEKAREKGIFFVHYTREKSPKVEANHEELSVEFVDHILGKKVLVETDAVILSTGFVVNDENNEDLATVFRLPRTTNGLFLEGHTKFNPTDFSNYGFFMAGSVHAPKTIRESITQAYAVAARAQIILSKIDLTARSSVAIINKERCASCLVCVRFCPFSIPYINTEGFSEIDPSKCYGCGVCAAECPAKAIELTCFESNRTLAKVIGLSER